MLSLQHVTRRFRSPGGDVTALRDVSLDIPSGGVWAVVGPNGAGKTTLFALALGFLRPSDGRVTLAGQNPGQFVRRRGAAYLPERFALPPGWRVRAALYAFARLDGLDRATARIRAQTALERLGLEPHVERPVGDLSRGLLQRVGLAQTLLTDRPVVVLDEPTEGLDPLWRIRLRDLIAELRAADRLVLIASHALAEVERVADRAVLLEDGRVRDVLDVAAPTGGLTRYRIRLARPSSAMAEVFPDATPVEHAKAANSATPVDPATPANAATATEYVVVVKDTAELSQRVAALLACDVTLVEAAPLVEPLEERVRRTLDRGKDDDGTATDVPATEPADPADAGGDA